jgi:hypothetical protein
VTKNRRRAGARRRFFLFATESIGVIYDAAVTAPRRRAAHSLPSIVGMSLALIVVACGPSSASLPPPATATAPSLTPVPGGPASPVIGASVGPPSTSNVEGFGEIWDGLPPSWPKFPGQSQSEIGSDASEVLVVKGDPAALAIQLRRTLEQRGSWGVDIGSALEDGTVMLEAIGAPEGCKVRARFTPNTPGSDEGTLQVYYGAKCPWT